DSLLLAHGRWHNPCLPLTNKCGKGKGQQKAQYMRRMTRPVVPSLVLSSLVAVILSSFQVHADEQIRYDDGPLMRSQGEFVLDGRSWLPKMALTYGFVNMPSNLDAATVRAAVADAFALWEAATPLTFTEVPDCAMPFDFPNCTKPDIRIQFA